MCQKERDHAMSVALYQMSSRMRAFIEDALSKSTDPSETGQESVPVTVVKENYDKFARSSTSASDSRPPSGKNSDRGRSPRRKGGCSRVTSRPHSAVAKSGLSRPSSASRTGKGDPEKGGLSTKRPWTAKERAFSQSRVEGMEDRNSDFTATVSITDAKARGDAEQLLSSSLGYVSIDSGVASGASRSRSSLGGHRCRSPLNKRPTTPAVESAAVGTLRDTCITPGIAFSHLKLLEVTKIFL